MHSANKHANSRKFGLCVAGILPAQRFHRVYERWTGSMKPNFEIKPTNFPVKPTNLKIKPTNIRIKPTKTQVTVNE
jgi:hypothetical protein